MSRPLLEILAPILGPDESVIDVTTGFIPVRRMGSDVKRQGLVVATNRRVLLYTEKLGGYDYQDFAYGLLSSVDYKKGVMLGILILPPRATGSG